jgi:hypothetical protein
MNPATSLAGLSPELFFGLAFLKRESYWVDRLVAMMRVDELPYTYFEARCQSASRLVLLAGKSCLHKKTSRLFSVL